MSTLPKAIKFQELNNELTDQEFKRFLHEVIESCGRHVIVNSIFNNIRDAKTNKKTANKMNDIMHEIIDSRDEKEARQEDKHQIQIENLSKNLLGQIASFLSQSDYASISILSRRIYISVNTPNVLHKMEVTKTNHQLIKFEHYTMLKSLYLRAEKINIKMDINEPKDIIENMLNTKYRIVRAVMMNYFISTLNKMTTNTSKRQTQIKTIISMMVQQLHKVSQIACDQTIIDNSNDTFPDDLKNYTERLPKLDKYFQCLLELMRLFPNQIVSQLITEKNWNLLMDTFIALENGANSFPWAKNDDKLLVMQIMIDLIDTHNVDPKQLFDTKLINALTSQFLIATRSDVVSPHMEQVVSITYRLLTHFAFEPEIDEDEDDDDVEKDWIANKIVNQHWFLWAVQDIVAPHNVYGSSVAATAIYKFIEKIINYKCVQNATNEMINKIIKKWEGNPSNSRKKLEQYPREIVLKLLMTILKTEEDHFFFTLQNGKTTVKCINRWIQNFFFTYFLKNEEELTTYNVGLDFFQFHVDAVIKYPSLQTEMFTKFIRRYCEAIFCIFAYYAHKKNDEKWNQLKNKALALLQSIFDLEKSYKSDQKIIVNFLNDMVRTALLPFSPCIDDYNKSETSLDDELMVIEYLENLNKNSKNVTLMEKMLSKNCGWENKPECLERICRVLQKFLINYNDTDKFQYKDDNFDSKFQNNVLSIMVSCWFLQLMGHKFPEIIERSVKLYLDYICEPDDIAPQFESNPTCWAILCVLLASNSLKKQVFENELNIRILRCLTLGIIKSTDDEECKTLQLAKQNTLRKYLPTKLDTYLKAMETVLISPVWGQDQIYDTINTKFVGFIKYYWFAMNDNVAFISISDDTKSWNGRILKLSHLIKVINGHLIDNDICCDVKSKIIKYLTDISKHIANKLKG